MSTGQTPRTPGARCDGGRTGGIPRPVTCLRTALRALVGLALLTAAAIVAGPQAGQETPRPIPRMAWIPAWPLSSLVLEPLTLPPLIAPSCPNRPAINAPGVLCEDFDTDRNGVPGFQWSRLPLRAQPHDPLRPYGDPNDDVLGFTLGTLPGYTGTSAVTCAKDAAKGYATCVPVAEENDWHLHSPAEGPGDGYDPDHPGRGAPDGGKAHGGTRSMHMGRHLDASTTLSDTLRLRQVSAFVLDSQGDPSLPGLAIGPGSTLEFWHMISVPDNENFGAGFWENLSFGGGQVQLSLLGAAGTFEAWRRLTPSLNGYDSFSRGYSLCGFDPGDDQLAPADETMCDPAPLYSDKGDVFGTDASCTIDTDANDSAHKDCGDISCTPGPGCTENGSVGVGVWTRSAFDLSPFAWRVARLRWIGMVNGGWSFGTDRSALEPASPPAYQYYDGDDGWWIDDIVLTDLRVSGLPCTDDTDGDGVENCADCNTDDPDRWAGPGEVINLAFLPDRMTLAWSPPLQPGATALTYDTIRSRHPASFWNTGYPGYATCVESGDGADNSAFDPVEPAIGAAFYYLIRAYSGCPEETGIGSLGKRSDGTTRAGRLCP